MCNPLMDRCERTSQERRTSPRFTSVVGDTPNQHGLRPFVLHIKVFIDAPDRHVEPRHGRRHARTYRCHPASKAKIFRDFRQSIHEVWNDQLWLAPENLPRAEAFQCGITLTQVTEANLADLHICVLCDPHPRFNRPHCEIGGIPTRGPGHAEMFIEYPDHARHGAPRPFMARLHSAVSGQRGTSTFYQDRAAHELGHYLGIHHTCFAATGDDESVESYCPGGTLHQVDSLMAVGSAMRREYGHVWRRRLHDHHVHCGGGYTPRLDPASFREWQEQRGIAAH